MSKIGYARAVRLRQRTFSLVFALSVIPIYTEVCNIKGQISASSYTILKPSLSSSHVSQDNLHFRVHPHSQTALARIFAGFALSAILIYTQVCNIKGQISARV